MYQKADNVTSKQSIMADRRALLTDREREIVANEADVSDEYRYQTISRVRSRFEKLEGDLAALEAHGDLADELRTKVCDDKTEMLDADEVENNLENTVTAGMSNKRDRESPRDEQGSGEAASNKESHDPVITKPNLTADDINRSSCRDEQESTDTASSDDSDEPVITKPDLTADDITQPSSGDEQEPADTSSSGDSDEPVITKPDPITDDDDLNT